MVKISRRDFDARCEARRIKSSGVGVLVKLLKGLKRAKLKPSGTHRDLEYKHKKKRF